MKDGTAADELFPGDDPTSAAHRATDWAATPLGPPGSWPEELRSAVRTLMPSRIPMLLWWSHELVQIFNDPYTSVLGDKFPTAVGQRAADCWAEIWDIVGPLTERALGGESTYSHDQLLFLLRHGFLEETYWTFSYSPIEDPAGRVGGVFVATSEVTGQVVGDRRLALLRRLGELSIAEADSATDAVRAAARILGGGPADLPVGMVYLREDQLDSADGPAREGDDVRLVASFGLVEPAEPSAVAGTPPEVAEAVKTGRPVRITGLTGTTWPTVRTDRVGEPAAVDEAVALPLLAIGHRRPVGVLVLGVSPYLALDEPYRHFLDLVASRVSTALTDVLAYEAQRRRVAALAELDAAKTEFFTDVSHELRTPLTLIIGPVQESLADEREPLPPAQRERLELVHRNAGRLHKLVNDMLDFARVEGGRLEAERVPTDLAALTRGIAESFGYAMERGGLAFEVDVRPLPRTGYVDRDMWEKVVVNLLSNALKYTLAGTVRLRLAGDHDTVTLSVSDTGVGIPADQQPLLFRRFHRVRGSGGRSHEGAGIGLALVQELVRLHGGEVGLRSIEGEGSTFTVRIPYGRPTAERPGGPVPAPGSYGDQALRWMPEALPGPAATDRAGGQAPPAGAPTVLVVEDNRDLRGFLVSLLGPSYRVLAAEDGRAALDLVATELPDLVLTDVMMPRMDGFALLTALRGDRRTAGVPVILLSARAGEEAVVEGLRAGADDYLPKPFSSLELLARVRAHLELARLRNREATWRTALIDSLQDAFVVYDASFTLVEANHAFCRLLGLDRLELPAPAPHPWWPDPDTEPADRREVEAAIREMRTADGGRVTAPLRHADGHRIWVEAVYNALGEPVTGQRLHVATLRDVTAEIRATARQAAVTALATRLASASDITEVLEGGLAELGELLGGARGVAVSPDPAGTPVVVGAGLELTPQIRRILDPTGPADDPYLARDDAGRVTGVGARVDTGIGVAGIWLEPDAPRPMSAVDAPLIRQLCAALAQALVRAHAYETQRGVALAMQRAMLGPTDLPAGFAVRYEPAVLPLEVGGDWYDVVPMPGDLFGVVVGDCVGRGLSAATVMGQLRSACRALLLQAKSPAEVLSALDGFARLTPGGACTTVFCAIIDCAGGELRYSSAGHPPGILMHPDGATELLDGAGSVPLASVAVDRRPEAVAAVVPGSTLLLYTDGLVERRRELIDAGIARAVKVLTDGRGLPEGALVDRLVRDLLPASGSDDAAVLVYRHRAPTVFTASVPADPAELAPTRERLRAWLHDLGVDEWDVQTVLIATGEACANAIEHGYRFAPGAITTLRAELREDRLEIEVRDHGGWREGDPDDGADRGRGRLIMARVMDEVTIVGAPEGTTVRMVKRLSGGS
ncbi:SpoIIE family protein phosphatase [Micromonospora inositola]|uniref:histidine kinase n=1 Tax=Micromonospora inositola TaxID=47865 RepID=A0A1C5JA68_9ACTN|nr:SpoIIE family protein phosphatase [Micromonospora inositola]SCG67433.1 PAS/PAC sensor hybrid histidine kinase [Micromonospora inositola]